MLYAYGPAAILEFSPIRRLDAYGLAAIFFPALTPLRTRTLMLQHWWLSPPELFVSIKQDAHHTTRPAHPTLVPFHCTLAEVRA
jgi:hypothetical protein